MPRFFPQDVHPIHLRVSGTMNVQGRLSAFGDGVFAAAAGSPRATAFSNRSGRRRNIPPLISNFTRFTVHRRTSSSASHLTGKSCSNLACLSRRRFSFFSPLSKLMKFSNHGCLSDIISMTGSNCCIVTGIS